MGRRGAGVEHRPWDISPVVAAELVQLDPLLLQVDHSGIGASM